MTSILLLTLLSWLHCHPGVIGSVSLLPVAKVVASDVLKEAGRVFRGIEMKSLSKLVASNPAGRGVISFPLASKKLSQSTVLGGPTDVGCRCVALTSPSSWNTSSWTANALETR